jgi:hypothetical protein
MQLTNCWVERVFNEPEFMAACDSIVAVEAKAQHEPQCPWSLTGVTTPLFLQSTLVGSESISS